MKKRRSAFIAAAIASAALCGASLSAQTLEDSVDSALKKDGLIQTEVKIQRDISVKSADDMRVEFDRGGNRGGDRGGDHGRDRGGDHGRDRSGDHNGGGNNGGNHRWPGPGDHNGGDRGGDHGRPGGHWNPGRDRGEWGRWHGHPGWGRHYGRWGWDDIGRPHWWGWVVWGGIFGRSSCIYHYDGLLAVCNNNCQVENDECLMACGPFDDGFCIAQCNIDHTYCGLACREDREDYVRSCPLY